MTAEKSARAALRAGTSSHHDKVDALFTRAVLTDRTSYGRFLTAQAAAHLPVEAALDHGGITAIVGDWSSRARGNLLRADLGDLGLVIPEPIAIARFDDDASLLGALYVLEGSRLGGQLLGRTVPPDFPKRFLGGGTSSAWQQLLAVLEGRLDTREARATAVGAACAVFRLFENAGERYLGR